MLKNIALPPTSCSIVFVILVELLKWFVLINIYSTFMILQVLPSGSSNHSHVK